MSIDFSKLHDKQYRLNNIYNIVDKEGRSIPFKLNAVQKEVAEDPHNRKIILKARQLGMSTYAVLDMLDDVLFTPNMTGGIVSYAVDHAQHILSKIIGHALETMSPRLRPLIGVTSQSARKISFSNGSSLRVDTTLRGGTYQNILISEFGKTCARSPLKAEEVVTGTLQAVAKEGKVVIESTGEGTEGYFAELVHKAHLQGEPTSPLQYKLFFFPWYTDAGYIEKYDRDMSLEDKKYFEEVEEEAGVTLSQHQKNWYIYQKNILNDKVRQEFPSTISEAFLSNSDAYYFALYIEDAHKDDRCLYTSIHDALHPVYVAMDIGVNDLTVIIFFQVVHGEIRVIDYYEDMNKGVDFYAHYLLHDKRYTYHTIFLPHDSKQRSQLDATCTYERDLRRLFSGVPTRFHVLKAKDKNLSISHAKILFKRCTFAMKRVEKLVQHLAKYRKQWSEKTGKYLDKPLHDVHSNYADAFRYMCDGVSSIEALSGQGDALTKHKKAVAMRKKAVY